MIVIPSAPTGHIGLVYASWQTTRAGVPPTDALTDAIELLTPPAVGIFDGYIQFSHYNPSRALELLPVGKTNTGNISVRVWGFRPQSWQRQDTSITDRTVKKWSHRGAVLFEGSCAALTTTGYTNQNAAGTSEPLYGASGVWTMTHGSTANVIVPDIVNTTNLSPVPIIVPVNGAEIVYIRVWGSGDDTNCLVGIIG